MRILLKIGESASQMFVSVGVCTFKALFRKLMFTFIESLNGSANSIISVLMNPTVNFSCYSSSLMNQWLKCLCKLISYNCAMCNIRFVFIVDYISDIASCFKYIYIYIHFMLCFFCVIMDLSLLIKLVSVSPKPICLSPAIFLHLIGH